MLEIVARISSRVFLGEDICRNDAWLNVTKNYTVLAFSSAAKLNLVPSFLRSLINVSDSDCRKVRSTLTKAREILRPVVENRKRLRDEAKANGTSVPVFDDAIEWAEQEAGEHPYDAAAFQLAMSFVAIHTTTGLLSITLVCLANQPELIEPLGKEIVDVLRADGWNKTALFNMKLLDSTIKEAQRITQGSDLVQLRRLALEDVTLPDGTIIHKGQRIVVDSSNMVNPELFPEPHKFDIYRFRRMREEPGNKPKTQLVAASTEHIGFGHGGYACPGRFFASNEIKVALCQLLLKYDWKLPVGTAPKHVFVGTNLQIDPNTIITFKRRKEEVNLETLMFEVI